MVDRTAPYSGVASLMALQGRMGDTELVHMSKPEIRGLASLGKITVNPDTGLPEAFNLKSMLPVVGAIAGTMLLGPGIGTALGGGAFGSIGGAAIGSALGSFGGGVLAGQSIGDAARGAAISGVGAGLTAGLFPSGFDLPSTAVGSSAVPSEAALAATGPELFYASGSVPTVAPSFPVGDAVSNFFSPSATPAVTQAATKTVAEPSLVSKALGFAKEHPFLTAGGVGLLGAGLMEGQEEQQQLAYEEPIYKREPVSLEGGEQVAALTPEEYEQLYTQGGGTQEQITSLQSPFRYVPKSTYASHGGLIGLADGGAVQKFLDSEGAEAPSNSPSTSTPQSASYSIDSTTGAYTGTSPLDMAKTGLGVFGLLTGNPVASGISAAIGLGNAISNMTNPNVAIGSAPVAGQVGISPFGMFSSQAPQIAAMREDIARDVDGPVSGIGGPAAANMSLGAGQSFGTGFDYSLDEIDFTDVDDGSEDNDSAASGEGNEDSQEGGMWKTGGLIGLQDGGMVTVQPGDTLTKIANETGMTVEGLQSLNNITNPNIIQAGQQLKISEGDSGLDIASIKEKVTDFLSNLPEEVISGIMSLVPEGVLELFNKPEVEDTTDSKQVEQSEYPRPPEMPSTISDMRAVNNPATYKKLLDRGITFEEIQDLIKGEHVKGNPLTEVSPEGATGLFQFMPETAKDVKTNTDAISKMTAEEQVDVYDRYLTMFGWEKGIPLGFMQAAPGKAKKFSSMKDSDIIYSKDSKKAKANPQWRDSKGNVTKGSVLKHFNSPVMKAKGGNIGHYFQGQVDGGGDGQSDNVPFKVDARSKSDPSGALLSVDEYVLPADVVSMMGNGSSNAGASKLDNFVKSVRKESFGTAKQQKPYNTERGLSALV
jgi:LysM repeat protein